MPFNVQIRHNPEYRGGSGEPRYFLYIDLSLLFSRPVSQEIRKRLPRVLTPLVPPAVSAWLEVFWRPNPGHSILKEVYWVEVAGRRLEKGNLPSLMQAVPEFLSGMGGFGTFPYYYLIYPQGEPLPVYHNEGKLRLKMNRSGISGYDIGEVWQQVGDGLLGKKLISSREELEVHLLLWQDLSLYPMALALKGGRFLIPLFQGEGQEILYDVIGEPTRFLHPRDAFPLRREVAQSLMATRNLSSPYELGMEGVLPQVWQDLEGGASPTGLSLYYPTERSRVEMPVYEVSGEFFALATEKKHRLYFSATPEELVPRVAMELSRERRLSSSALLSIEKHKGR
ncbi:MAG: hypothetical protein WAK96_04155 [Desulfobaccales bacterium]